MTRRDRDPNRGNRRIPLTTTSAADLLGLNDCPTCGHSTAPLWFGQPGSGDHSEDDGSCIACGPELGRRCAT